MDDIKQAKELKIIDKNDMNSIGTFYISGNKNQTIGLQDNINDKNQVFNNDISEGENLINYSVCDSSCSFFMIVYMILRYIMENVLLVMVCRGVS